MKTKQILSLLIFPILSHAAELDVNLEKSRIQVDAKATGHSFTGTLASYTARVEGDSVSNKPVSFDLDWSFKNLKTADPKRDKEMMAWLGGGDPKGNFHFSKTWVDQQGKNHASGNLSINGISKPISFPYTVKKEGDWVSIDGKVEMDYRNFDLPMIRAMAVMTVDPKLVVRFHIVGQIK